MRYASGQVGFARLDPVTGRNVDESVVALMTSTALAIAQVDDLPAECRTSEAVIGMVEKHLLLLSYTLPDEILLTARSLCFHMRNQMEGVCGGR